MQYKLKSYEEGGLWIIKDHEVLSQSLMKSDSFKKSLIKIQDEYKIYENSLRFLSYGGQGILYVGLSKKFHDYVTIKMPFYNPYEYDSSKELALLKEAKLLESFIGTNTSYVPILFGYDSTGKYLIKKYYSQYTLEWILNNKPYDANRICYALLAQFCWINSFFIDNGKMIILSDWKPSNILFDTVNYSPILIDFGNMKEKKDIIPDTKLSISKIGSGHFVHWPPELLLGESDNCNESCNSFILGSLLFLILTGSLPYMNNHHCSLKSTLLLKYKDDYRKANNLMNDTILSGITEASLGKYVIDLINPSFSERRNIYDFTFF